jgi:DMSO/TMAO reductase YedYZ molybdopterin-dependent catalytic subunit
MSMAFKKRLRSRLALYALAAVMGLAAAMSIAGVSSARANEPHGHAAAAPTTSATITVGGKVTTPLVLDAAALAAMPRATVEASAHGVEGEWSGVPLVEVLRAAGAPLGDALRGGNLALYVRISAADGYRVVYALAELDPKFRDDGVLLVDTHDGKPLDADSGPFRLVAPAEKRPGRWVRQVTRIDVLESAD